MTPTHLKKLAKRTFGDDWKQELAKQVPLTIRSINRYLTKDRKITPIVAARIEQICLQHIPAK